MCKLIVSIVANLGKEAVFEKIERVVSVLNPEPIHISNIRKLKANFVDVKKKVTFIVKTF